MAKTISLRIKEALAEALRGLGATSDGTEVLQVVTSGADQFDKYPTIRVLPQDYNRSINGDTNEYEYTMTYIVSIYLELAGEGEEATPDQAVIDAMQELVDMVFEELDYGDWLDDIKLPKAGSLYVAQNDAPVVIDVTNTKTGIALYADITYSVAYKTNF